MDFLNFIKDYPEVTTGFMVMVVIGLSQALKAMGVNAKIIPLVNILFGLVGCVALLQGVDLPLRVFNGVIVGLCASGLFSGAKNVYQGVSKD